MAAELLFVSLMDDTVPTPLRDGRNWTKADVFPAEDGPFMVKSVARRAWFSRRFVGGALVRREARVLDRLRGFAGVSQLVRSDRVSLVTRRVEGRRLYDLRKQGIDEGVAGGIEAAVRALHERGFAHGDLGRRDILLGPDGQVTLLDFATAVGRGFPPVLWRVLLPLWKRRDLARVRRLTARYRGRRENRRGAAAERAVASPAAPTGS